MRKGSIKIISAASPAKKLNVSIPTHADIRASSNIPAFNTNQILNYPYINPNIILKANRIPILKVSNLSPEERISPKVPFSNPSFR